MAAAMALASAPPAFAAEAFEPRYNMDGSLGGEMFAPPSKSGWATGFAISHIDIAKVTGNGGALPSASVPGGVVPLPAPTPAELNPSYGPGTVQFAGSGP